MKGLIGIFIYSVFLLSGEMTAQKTRKYTIKKEIQLSAFDSIVKHSFKNKILIASACDTSLLIDQMAIFKTAIEHDSKDQIGLLCDLGNIYHAWMMLTLCRRPSIIRADNDRDFYVRDTMILDKVPYTLQSLRVAILKLGEKSKLHLPFILWNGTISGAHPPKKSWTPQSLKSLIVSSGKSFFKHAGDEFTADVTVNTICIAEDFVNELFMHEEQKDITFTAIFPKIVQYLPEHIAAYCALNKTIMQLRTLSSSDILARSP